MEKNECIEVQSKRCCMTVGVTIYNPAVVIILSCKG